MSFNSTQPFDVYDVEPSPQCASVTRRSPHAAPPPRAQAAAMALDAAPSLGHGFAPRERSGPSLKRALDLAIAIPALIFLLPFMLCVAALVRLADGGPAIFSQPRIGRNGEVFRCLKFRSMIINAQEVLDHVLATDPDAAAEWAADQKLRNDPRITRVGAFLRKTSLDELPQLINVVRGEMSIVGPRPIIRDEIPRYGRSFADYTSVRPGLTGLWQVSGRNDTTYAERVAMDRLYARQHSVAGDLAIIVKTVPAMLASRGAF